MSEPTPLEAIFFAALAKAPAQRAGYLNEACAGDEKLRQHVERMLSAQAEAGSFLESPPSAVVDAGATLDQAVSERPGTQIGPYKLLQQIGEGGMGVVYMAEQTEPIARRVALKIIKPGMDTRQVIARFEAERQALAMMDHANIARVLDAGSTGAGRPFFVMELVHGIPITRYCDENHLTPRERLELFVPVCQAIQHAHQKGIIHRDIKPSNVMVTLYDGQPVPKVIDFGVAKATEQKLTERTLFTQYGTMVGTLEYMSPEQAEMSALGVDTRSDIYSLGVLLYELLTGSTPLTHKRMKEAAYGEILRLIKEEEPQKPSTRLSDSAEELASISALRHTEPAKLSKMMRGELDWIVMKTLEKDRNRRYETASGFAADVQRYLNDEPVQACPPSASYRLRKFLRRNKGPMLAASLVLVALLTGLAASVWQAVRATRAEALAQQNEQQARKERDEKEIARREAVANESKALSAAEAEKRARQEADESRQQAQSNFQKALDAVDQMLTEVGQESLANVPQMEPVRRALLEKALKFYQDFLKQKSTDPSLRYETARAYQRVDAIYSLLGQYGEAVAASRQAIAILEQLEAEFPAERDYRYQLGLSYKSLGHRLRLHDEPAEAAYRQAIARHEKLASEFPGEPVYQTALAHDYNSFAYFLGRNRVKDAEQMYGKAIVLLQDLTARFPDVDDYRGSLAEVSRALGVLLWRMRRFEEAERPLRQAIALLEAMNANTPNAVRHQQTLARSRFHLGCVLDSSCRTEEAEELYQAAKAVQEKLLADFPSTREYQWELAESLDSLAMLRVAGGRAEEAKELWEKARRIYPPYSSLPNNRAWSLATSPDPKMRDPVLAVKLARQVDQDVPNNGTYLNTLGAAEYRAGNWKESVAALQKSMDVFKGELDAFNAFFLAMAHWQLGEKDEARKCFDRAVEWMDKHQPENEELRRFRVEAEELLEIKAKS